jgi:CubicO group peptidase (beta-lactamase class C family)
MRYAWRMGFLRLFRFCRIGILLTTSATSPAPAHAAQALLSAPFRDTIERGIANRAWRHLAIGVIDGKQRSTFYFGNDPRHGAKPANADSLFEIGAVSEVFAGILLAQAAVEGKLRLTDPIATFLPAPFPFADPQLGRISLEQLATQHSGLPARPANLFPADINDAYADYAAEDLLAFLALYRPETASADEYRYSLLNVGLLGHILGRVYRAPYADVLAAKVLNPLGLRHTSLGDAPGLLTGYAHGVATANRHYGVLAAAAGLRTNLDDALDLLQQYLTPENSPLRAALLLSRQPRIAAVADQLGLGWNVREMIDGERSWPLVWRASQTAGFASFIGFRTDRQKAIVVLGDAAEDVAALGMAWLGDTLPPEAPRAPAAPVALDLSLYPGLYRLAPGSEAIVRADTGGLSLQLPGKLPLPLNAVGADMFAADGGAVGVTFMRVVDEITGVVLHIDGNNSSAPRLSARAPRLVRGSIEPSPRERASLVGDYRVDPATWLRIADSDGVLSLQPTLGKRRVIFAFAADRYTDGDGAIELEFKRDAGGRIIAVDLDLAGVRRTAVPARKISP